MTDHPKKLKKSLSLPNKNTIVIIWQYFRWDKKKYNEIQLTKNKMGLNNLKIKNNLLSSIALLILTMIIKYFINLICNNCILHW